MYWSFKSTEGLENHIKWTSPFAKLLEVTIKALLCYKDYQFKEAGWKIIFETVLQVGRSNTE